MEKMTKKIPVYLLVADETEEFGTALHYAARLAKVQGARLAVLRVFEEPEIQPWGGIGRMMHYEYLHEAEDILHEACNKIIEATGKMPVVYLERDARKERIAEIIDEDPAITKLILGGNVHSNTPGPLVSYFTGKGLPKLRVPLTVVPGDLKDDII